MAAAAEEVVVAEAAIEEEVAATVAAVEEEVAATVAMVEEVPRVEEVPSVGALVQA